MHFQEKKGKLTEKTKGSHLKKKIKLDLINKQKSDDNIKFTKVTLLNSCNRLKRQDQKVKREESIDDDDDDDDDDDGEIKFTKVTSLNPRKRLKRQDKRVKKQESVDDVDDIKLTNDTLLHPHDRIIKGDKKK